MSETLDDSIMNNIYDPILLARWREYRIQLRHRARLIGWMEDAAVDTLSTREALQLGRDVETYGVYDAVLLLSPSGFNALAPEILANIHKL